MDKAHFFEDLNPKKAAIAFHNIPKTGGTSVNYFVNNYFAEKSINIGIHSAAALFFQRKKQFLDYSEAERDRFKFIQSHSLNLNDLRFFSSSPFLLMTVIRDPIELEISAYNHFSKEQKRIGKVVPSIEEFFDNRPVNPFAHKIQSSWKGLINENNQTFDQSVDSILKLFRFVIPLPSLNSSFPKIMKKYFHVNGNMDTRRVNQEKDESFRDAEFLKKRVELDSELYNRFITDRKLENLNAPQIKSTAFDPKVQSSYKVKHIKSLSENMTNFNTAQNAIQQLAFDGPKQSYIDAELLLKFLIPAWDLKKEGLTVEEFAVLLESSTRWCKNNGVSNKRLIAYLKAEARQNTELAKQRDEFQTAYKAEAAQREALENTFLHKRIRPIFQRKKK